MKRSFILFAIIFSQFACTSLWFAGNAIVGPLSDVFSISGSQLSWITSSVQLGFIAGTLVFAILTIADRFSPSKVFLVSAILGALFNLSILFIPKAYSFLLLSRFATGFMLAGIYPVGMKIASDHHEKGLGKALGMLVGALVLGTAFPHFVNASFGELDWKLVIIVTSGLALVGGIVIGFLVPDGPFRKAAPKFEISAITRVFKEKDFRSAAFGYFGHMWELYAFWAFIPFMLTYYAKQTHMQLNVSMLAFYVIAIGALSSGIGGIIALKKGSRKVAFYSLLFSGICCVLSPTSYWLPFWLFFVFLLLWGVFVIADSPQFSTLVAQTAPDSYKGTALTIVNSIGFFITIFSIQLLGYLVTTDYAQFAHWLLVPGPVFGLLYFKKPG